MRIIIVGAGAVGVTLGVHLELLKHEVLYLVRPGRKQGMERLTLVDTQGERPRKRERPQVMELGSPLPPFEWALLCVRGDQTDEAIRVATEHLPRGAAVGLCSPDLDGCLERLRAARDGGRGGAGPSFLLFPTFSAWSEEENVWRWFQPPLLKTMLSGEGDPASDQVAGEMARTLEAAGLPARTVSSLRRQVAPLLAPGLALLAGWELAGWDAARLGGDRALRRLTANAMREAGRIAGRDAEGASALVGYLPAFALDLFLRALPRLTTQSVRSMWQHHGPELAGQTRRFLDEVIARAGEAGTSELRALRARLV